MALTSVPTTEATEKKISFEDYLLMPEINHLYEIIDGEFMPSPAPATCTSKNRFEHCYGTSSIRASERSRCSVLRAG